ncbi:30S ribosomal protein S5 [Candidatus Dojkabacteria bacterium]|nr:30S ribosomal protein S5 [Candidatus Dojkabacteria bacterium]
MKKNSRGGKFRRRKDVDDFEKRVINIRRVAKVTAGAKRLRFSVISAVGDKKGKVGLGLGRGLDTKAAIDKSFRYAQEHMKSIDIIGDTIPHEIEKKYRSARVMLKPAGPGTGVIASSAVRSVLEVVGIKNVLTKQLGSRNPLSNAYCAFYALCDLDKSRILRKRAEYRKSKLKKDDKHESKQS